VYQDFAPADDFWIGIGSTGQTHPHLMVLEVLIETGVAGLCGYGFALLLILRHMWALRTRELTASAYLMVALVAWFPLNAHLAFYGSYWSNIAWMLLALGCIGGNLRADRKLTGLNLGAARFTPPSARPEG
jgi:O-antigen ligase